MCDDHHHLGKKITTTYSDRNFVLELEQIEGKKTQLDSQIATQTKQLEEQKKKIEEQKGKIIWKLRKEVLDLFLANNEFREQISKPLIEVPSVVEKSVQELLAMLTTLKEENNSLVQEIRSRK